ncbi:unnamed protein product [Linum trigynum]|uniref:Uncharacterized protein n=1 Tax=Linum trigynum TaxID=586398 RepID=A0AAV2DR68_9ROSI
MVRPPCCGDDDEKVKKGPWTAEEDAKLVDYITNKGHTNWKSLPKLAGLNRCGKSCRLRWTNYLRPDIKRGKFSEEEERLIINLHSVLGNKWSRIATHLSGRTDNEIKNYYNTHIRKKLLQMGIDPQTHKPRTDHSQIAQIINLTQLIGAAQQLNSIMMLNNNNGIIGNSNNNNNNSVANSIIPLLHLLNPTTTSAASTFLAQQQQQQQMTSSQEELLLARLLNPAGAGSSAHQELFCNQFLNTLPALATGGGSSLMVNNNNNNGALATARESALPGLVSAEASPEASSSTSLVHHNNNVNGGVDGVMEAGNNNNNYPHLSNNSSNFSDGTTALSSPGTAADVDDNQYEAWEKMLLMDDDFVPTFGDSGFFSSWKDDDLVLE